MQEQMATTFFSSHPIPDGGTCTLTTDFGQLLFEAEALYGPRVPEWTPIGVEILADSKHPQIWFPGDRRHVCIRLTPAALTILKEARWQLAQEIVHVLSPVREATNLEEGLATHFALSVSIYGDPEYVKTRRNEMEGPESKYRLALADCESLLKAYPDIIKQIRKTEPYLSRITAEQILFCAASFDSTVRRRLATKFKQ